MPVADGCAVPPPSFFHVRTFGHTGRRPRFRRPDDGSLRIVNNHAGFRRIVCTTCAVMACSGAGKLDLAACGNRLIVNFNGSVALIGKPLGGHGRASGR